MKFKRVIDSNFKVGNFGAVTNIAQKKNNFKKAKDKARKVYSHVYELEIKK